MSLGMSVFDEIIYPFSKLHPNAVARLRNEITLLPDHNDVCLTYDLTLINSHDENSEQVCRRAEHRSGDAQCGEEISQHGEEIRQNNGEIRAGQHDFMHGDAGTQVEDDSQGDLRSQSVLGATPAAVGGRTKSASGLVQVPTTISPPIEESTRERRVAKSEQLTDAAPILR
jgi:hypothetical protein